MNAVVVIPARFASTRLPGKPLLNDTGKYLVQHAYEQATRSRRAGAVIVATDDPRIFDAVESFGGRAVMTRSDHPSGTDRIAEVATNLDAELIVNLQGDEPQFDPAHIDRLIDQIGSDPAIGMATLATPFRRKADYLNPNMVKVVCDAADRALYFSRSPIPMVRDGEPDFDRSPPLFLQHLGVYAYRRDVLLRLAATPPHPIERSEALEQLRALAHGIGIKVGVIESAHRGVDTPEDYAAFVQSYRTGRSR
jgi:3-deoxy-manno-octulosonate cytidylyltransferase (CMP-KDO synthetase)